MPEPRTRPLHARDLVLVLAVLSVALAGLASAQSYDARARTVTVVPSGADDTAALRTAFDVCAAVGPGCTVRLAEGTFRTRQHVVHGFDGRFVGAGRDRTFVEPLTPLPVNDHPNVLERPPSDAEPWPMLFLFVDPRMALADLTFRVTDPVVTTPWTIFDVQAEVLATIVALTGEDVWVDVARIGMEGGEGPFFGVNVINGLYVQGILPGPSGGFDDRPSVSGTVTVRDSRFVGPDGGVLVDNADGATVSIVGNEIDGVLSVYVQDVANSLIEVRGNDVKATTAAVFLSAGAFRTPAAPGQVLVVGNTLRPAAGGIGVLIADDGAAPTLRVWVADNTFELVDAAAAVAGNGVGAMVSDNVLRGSAAVGMRVGPEARPETAEAEDGAQPGPTAGWWIGGNDVRELATSGATVWVTEAAERIVLVCGAGGGTLRDEGQGTLAACD